MAHAFRATGLLLRRPRNAQRCLLRNWRRPVLVSDQNSRSLSLPSPDTLHSPGAGPVHNLRPSAAQGDGRRPQLPLRTDHGAMVLAGTSKTCGGLPDRAQTLTFLFLEICTAILLPRAAERKGSGSRAEVGI